MVNACTRHVVEGPAIQERSWPAYLGNPQRANAAESLASDPQPVWRTPVGRGIIGAPALTEGVVAVSLVDRRVALLDRATGTIIWNRRLNLPIGAGPLIADDRLFVAENDLGGRVYALRLSDGNTIWSARAGDTFAPLVLAEGGLFVATGEGNVGRLSPETGSYVWRARLGGTVRAAPVVTRAGVVVATQTDSLYLLDKNTGTIRVRRGVRGTVLAAPGLADSLLVVGTTAGRLEALNVETLATVWGLDLGDIVVGSVAIHAGRAYAMTGNGRLTIVPLNAPAQARRLEIGLASRAGPSPSVRGVYLGGVNGEIVLVDSSGVRLWSARIEAPIAEAVLLDSHTLFAASVRGNLVMFR